ncbi:hypothetical protein KZZ52_45730 [Dactylosporangium sp. AC04546]|uniref:glycine-rich protein n=1 Tax=Dactylosporangium sp. AC04546 TaxID=2862460 RepID=UPI002E7BB4C0|nr:glycine-rich protein [Dactylosporangium sp. AC04546]WVK81217.1 hypothetical protein KZZ52_45730 [Dactylosporangium sp. AC04546]
MPAGARSGWPRSARPGRSAPAATTACARSAAAGARAGARVGARAGGGGGYYGGGGGSGYSNRVGGPGGGSSYVDPARQEETPTFGTGDNYGFGEVTIDSLPITGPALSTLLLTALAALATGSAMVVAGGRPG